MDDVQQPRDPRDTTVALEAGDRDTSFRLIVAPGPAFAPRPDGKR